jgi:hypothetical protein
VCITPEGILGGRMPGSIELKDCPKFQVETITSRNHHMASVCKHPRVRIVSRHDDIEFVECLECGEVFDSEEFRDMEIEETVETEQAETDS